MILDANHIIQDIYYVNVVLWYHKTFGYSLVHVHRHTEIFQQGHLVTYGAVYAINTTNMQQWFPRYVSPSQIACWLSRAKKRNWLDNGEKGVCMYVSVVKWKLLIASKAIYTLEKKLPGACKDECQHASDELNAAQ